MRAATLLRFILPASLLCPLATSIACGDSASDGGGGSGAGTGEGAGSSLEGGICIDRAGPLRIVEPSGLQLKFRVLDVNGDPLRPLTASDVTLINDEKGIKFGEGAEGDSVSNVGATDKISIYSVVALDLSDSIFAAGAQDDVIAAAREFISATVTEPEDKFKHKVLFLAIGRPEATVFLGPDFSQDPSELNRILDAAVDEGPRGTTALYNAYLAGIAELESRGDDTREVVERFLVLLTDGTHEAGGEASLRSKALTAKHNSRATVYTVGIAGTYDACRLEELAGRGATPCSSATRGCREGSLCTDTAQPPSCTQFFPDVEAGSLSDAFRDVAARVEGIARSNYSVGICTPVAQSNSSVTLQVVVDGRGDQNTLGYCAQGIGECAVGGDGVCPCRALLTGELDECNAETVRTTELEPIQTCPMMDPSVYECSYLQIPNQEERGCPIKADDYRTLCLAGATGSGSGSGGGGDGGAGSGGDAGNGGTGATASSSAASTASVATATSSGGTGGAGGAPGSGGAGGL